MTAVLVSGATTPLGQALVRRLAAAGDTVLALGAEPPHEVTPSLPGGVRYLRVDLTHPRRVRTLLFGPVRELGITAIVHLALHRDAGLTGARARRLNVDATRLMLRLAEKHPTVRRFVLQSTAFVYRRRADQGDLLREDMELDLSPSAPQWVRDRVEADVSACARMGLSDGLGIAVLRFAEVLAPDCGSQLYGWLREGACLRPAGFDPMLDLLSLDDAAQALVAALRSDAEGVFNVPGADVLPLSRLVRLAGCRDVALPGPLVDLAYRVRRRLGRSAFRYDLNRWRLHANGVLDGARARDVLGYVASHPLVWPMSSPEGG